MSQNPSPYYAGQQQWRLAKELMQSLVNGTEQVPDEMYVQLRETTKRLHDVLKGPVAEDARKLRRDRIVECARASQQVCDQVEKLLREAKEAVKQEEQRRAS